MRVWYPPGTRVLVDVGAVFGDRRTPRLGTVTHCQVLPSSVYEIDLGEGEEIGGIPPAHVSLAPTSTTGATP